MIGYNRAIGVKHVILVQINTVNKTTLLIINPLTYFVTGRQLKMRIAE